MLGAPAGGAIVGGQPGVLSTRFASIKPAKGGVGVGNTVLSEYSRAGGFRA
jgi:hypothetical protein